MKLIGKNESESAPQPSAAHESEGSESAPQSSPEDEEQNEPYFPHEYEALYQPWNGQSPNSGDNDTAAHPIEA